jgi:hypothetical protein
MGIITNTQQAQLVSMQEMIGLRELANPFTLTELQNSLSIGEDDAMNLINAGKTLKLISEGMGNYTLDINKNIALAVKEEELLEDIRNGVDEVAGFSAVALLQNYGFSADTPIESSNNFNDSIAFIRRVLEATVASSANYPQALIDKVAKPLVLLDQLKEMINNEING